MIGVVVLNFSTNYAAVNCSSSLLLCLHFGFWLCFVYILFVWLSHSLSHVKCQVHFVFSVSAAAGELFCIPIILRSLCGNFTAAVAKHLTWLLMIIQLLCILGLYVCVSVHKDDLIYNGQKRNAAKMYWGVFWLLLVEGEGNWPEVDNFFGK